MKSSGAPSEQVGPVVAPSGADSASESPKSLAPRKRPPLQAILKFARTMRDADPAEIEAAATQLSQTHRWLAPLGYVAGTLALIVAGIKPLFKNWRLTLVELVPATWVWFSMWNLKAHVLDGRSIHHFHGWISVVGVLLMVIAATIAFYCNAYLRVLHWREAAAQYPLGGPRGKHPPKGHLVVGARFRDRPRFGQLCDRAIGIAVVHPLTPMCSGGDAGELRGRARGSGRYERASYETREGGSRGHRGSIGCGRRDTGIPLRPRRPADAWRALASHSRLCIVVHRSGAADRRDLGGEVGEAQLQVRGGHQIEAAPIPE